MRLDKVLQWNYKTTSTFKCAEEFKKKKSLSDNKQQKLNTIRWDEQRSCCIALHHITKVLLLPRPPPPVTAAPWTDDKALTVLSAATPR